MGILDSVTGLGGSYSGGDDFSADPVDAPDVTGPLDGGGDAAPAPAPAAPTLDFTDGFDAGPVAQPFAAVRAQDVDEVPSADDASAADDAPAAAGVFDDGFEAPRAAPAAVIAPLDLPRGGPDKQYDGLLVGAGGQVYPAGTPLADVPAVEPSGGVTNGQTIVYTNGILTDRDTQARSMQLIADATGSRVVGVHNATEGAIKDLLQSANDKLDDSFGRNQAVDSLAGTVYDELRAGNDVHLIGHSQGGLVTSRALTDVRNRLVGEAGMTRQEAEALLGRVTVETFGAAASSYPDGPQYTHTINRFDVVPNLVGLGEFADISPFSHAGRGAKVNYFSDWQGGVAANHSFDTTYLRHRVAP